ncbi:UDP-glucosyltransferase 2-like [Aricia agestis]|uniref:UDP-glucosyltransferase 2-like n=1 Tax=Aricia agestis TaxID=91739 RepID=UPI001C20C317|nr:UDP-glucosyltransferase 2-like [Aricia agestis]
MVAGGATDFQARGVILHPLRMKWMLLLLFTSSTCLSYRILSVQHAPSKSHYNLMMGLVKPLLEAGHEVTMITIYPDKKPIKNLRVIDLSVLQNAVDHVDIMKNDAKLMREMRRVVANISATITEHPEVRQALTGVNYDAVISEYFFSDVEAGYAATLQVPWIQLHGEMTPHLELLMDSLRGVATVPVIMNSVPIPMSLGQRLKNTLWYFLISYGFLKDYSASELEYQQKFGPLAEARGHKLRPYSEAIRDISVLFLNSHPSYAAARSLPPNVVEIGGYHIDDYVPPLPQDLQELLDSSKNGVVYFSMGSVIKAKLLAEKLKKDLLKMFSALPYTVLWKLEDKIENPPKNLHVRAWMPQPSILSHPNVKVFITHGGALSTIESLHFGKPILAVPVFGDQPSNAEQSVHAGRALMVPYSPDMVPELSVALNEMLSNDSYYKRAQYLSSLFHKRPLPPRKLVTSYVELAIESKGAHHLRSRSTLYKWYEIYMLDQAAVLLVILYVIYRILCKMATILKRTFSNKKLKTH